MLKRYIICLSIKVFALEKRSKAKKEYISKQYKKEQDMLIQRSIQNDNDMYTEEQLGKMLTGEKYDKDYLMKMLNDMK